VTRACCVCGATKHLRRYRGVEIQGGPAQWLCLDYAGCETRASAKRETLADE
jgi:hypothetical protein